MQGQEIGPAEQRRLTWLQDVANADDERLRVEAMGGSSGTRNSRHSDWRIFGEGMNSQQLESDLFKAWLITDYQHDYHLLKQVARVGESGGENDYSGETNFGEHSEDSLRDDDSSEEDSDSDEGDKGGAHDKDSPYESLRTMRKILLDEFGLDEDTLPKESQNSDENDDNENLLSNFEWLQSRISVEEQKVGMLKKKLEKSEMEKRHLEKIGYEEDVRVQNGGDRVRNRDTVRNGVLKNSGMKNTIDAGISNAGTSTSNPNNNISSNANTSTGITSMVSVPPLAYITAFLKSQKQNELSHFSFEKQQLEYLGLLREKDKREFELKSIFEDGVKDIWMQLKQKNDKNVETVYDMWKTFRVDSKRKLEEARKNAGTAGEEVEEVRQVVRRLEGLHEKDNERVAQEKGESIGTRLGTGSSTVTKESSSTAKKNPFQPKNEKAARILRLFVEQFHEATLLFTDLAERYQEAGQLRSVLTNKLRHQARQSLGRKEALKNEYIVLENAVETLASQSQINQAMEYHQGRITLIYNQIAKTESLMTTLMMEEIKAESNTKIIIGDKSRNSQFHI
jgi:hypothetical protein